MNEMKSFLNTKEFSLGKLTIVREVYPRSMPFWVLTQDGDPVNSFVLYKEEAFRLYQIRDNKDLEE